MEGFVLCRLIVRFVSKTFVVKYSVLRFTLLSIKGTAKRLSLRYLFVTSLTDKFDFWASVWYIEYLMIQQKERPNTDDYSQ